MCDRENRKSIKTAVKRSSIFTILCRACIFSFVSTYRFCNCVLDVMIRRMHSSKQYLPPSLHLYMQPGVYEMCTPYSQFSMPPENTLSLRLQFTETVTSRAYAALGSSAPPSEYTILQFPLTLRLLEINGFSKHSDTCRNNLLIVF